VQEGEAFLYSLDIFRKLPAVSGSRMIEYLRQKNIQLNELMSQKGPAIGIALRRVQEGEAFLGLRATCRRLRWPKLAEDQARPRPGTLPPASGDKSPPPQSGDKSGYALPFGKAQATSPRDPQSKVAAFLAEACRGWWAFDKPR